MPEGAAPANVISKDKDDWSPFSSRAAFELAELLYVKAEMSHSDMDSLFAIWNSTFLAAGYESKAPFTNHRDLLRTIDSIDVGDVPWESFKVRYSGEIPPDPPKWMTDEHWVYCRNFNSIVRSQLANKEFDGHIDYRAYKEFGVDGLRRFGNYFSGDFPNRQSV